MFYEKRAIALVLSLVMAIGLAGCGKGTDSTENSTENSVAATSENSQGASVKKSEVTICGTNGPGDTQSIAHQNYASALNNEGDWNAVAMVSSEMGSTDDVLEQAMAGAPVIATTDPARLAAYVPEMGILAMPYMFESYDDVEKIMSTELYAQWKAKLRDAGLVLLTNNGITGFRNYVTNKTVNTPADLKGVKIRTMGSTIAINSINAMGAVATSLPQSDAYNGIQTGVVDGGEWQVPTIYSLRMYEVCDHISLSKHFLLTCSVVCSAKWYDSLTEKQQKELEELAVTEYGKTKDMVLDAEDKYLKEMEGKGVTIDHPDVEAFREATNDLYSDKITTGGADYLAIREELYKQMGITK